MLYSLNMEAYLTISEELNAKISDNKLKIRCVKTLSEYQIIVDSGDLYLRTMVFDFEYIIDRIEHMVNSILYLRENPGKVVEEMTDDEIREEFKLYTPCSD